MSGYGDICLNISFAYFFLILVKNCHSGFDTVDLREPREGIADVRMLVLSIYIIWVNIDMTGKKHSLVGSLWPKSGEKITTCLRVTGILGILPRGKRESSQDRCSFNLVAVSI
ncbi:hypothetical protein MLD38_003593 [Melastoma candidum]|uniref:Uncharacterized protein n=1 Tax=Melastoma candidum TaxID=119954 RepID=A0ACB9S339_9MYRT|nr:hypothetical protein MLD38_003593 [Melastoma candidum]